MVRNTKGFRTSPRSRKLRRLAATENATHALAAEFTSQTRPVPSGH